MVREVFDLPDGSDTVLIRAEAFLRKRIGELGGELYKKLEAMGCNEYPCFEAQFYLPAEEWEEEDAQDEQEFSYELAELYQHLDAIKSEYARRFEKYL